MLCCYSDMNGDDDYPWSEMLDEEKVGAEEQHDFDVDFDLGFDFDEDSFSSPSGTTPSPDRKTKSNGNGRKRRHRKRRRIYAPRIVQNDVRRHYAAMVTNVHNSFDEKAYASFWTTFAVPNMRVRKSVLLDLPTSKSFQDSFRHDVIDDIGSGQKWSILCFSVTKTLCPDNIMRILSSQLYSCSNTSKTLLTLKVRFDSTRLHNVNPLLFTEDMFESLSKAQSHVSSTDVPPNSSFKVFRSLANRVDPFDYFKQKVGSDIPLLDKPQPVAFVVAVRLFIDEWKRIEMVEIADAEFV